MSPRLTPGLRPPSPFSKAEMDAFVGDVEDLVWLLQEGDFPSSFNRVLGAFRPQIKAIAEVATALRLIEGPSLSDTGSLSPLTPEVVAARLRLRG